MSVTIPYIWANYGDLSPRRSSPNGGEKYKGIPSKKMTETYIEV